MMIKRLPQILMSLIILTSCYPLSTVQASAQTTTMYTTAKNGLHDRPSQVQLSTRQQALMKQDHYVQVIDTEKQQTFSGVGGALTDSAAHVLKTATPAHRNQILDAYFGKNGAHYTNVRLTIGSSDFSTHSYDYDTMPSGKTDPTLKHFSMAADKVNVAPILKQIRMRDAQLTFYAAPWAPPAWMKESHNRLGNSFITNNALKRSAYKSYADYLVKYLKTQQENGISIRYLSLQNELQASSPWESLTWTPDAAADFITNYLGPALTQSHLKTQLLVWDYVRSNLTQPVMMGFNTWTQFFYAHPDVTKYVHGIGIHWYAANLDPQMIIGNIKQQPAWDDNFTNLDRFHTLEPHQHILATEATQERGVWLNSWRPASHYAYDIIHDFNHHVESYLDWNLVLDEHGGPTHAGINNPCSAPINVLHAGQQNERVVINPAYYVLKRVSREAQPGTVSVKTHSHRVNVDATAIMQRNKAVTVLLNNPDNRPATLKVVNGHTVAQVTLLPHSFNSIRLPKAAGQLSAVRQPKANVWQQRWQYFSQHWLVPLMP
ncbi:glycoside hydrolase family 30 protein [Furfurilactobacillus siliginis]|uniref:Glycosyl hydrolase n=1 Tax=Furfurilactobacillus siliginis TaxID=348151 RepID=A0A0R2L6A0_9LACO|nr:hypothetical protein [Furfurilactobacillus siliginis]KRN96977.1 hypothetical protein IV55_GL000853 [Furfurilactobacillus siliginis]GEK27736.1 glycosyl hydrolase [Furfurilactobacillus siliginis]